MGTKKKVDQLEKDILNLILAFNDASRGNELCYVDEIKFKNHFDIRMAWPIVSVNVIIKTKKI